MDGLVGGGKRAVACDELLKSDRGPRRGFVSGAGEAKVRAVGLAIERGNYFQPCSARKRARICKARWRAAWSSWGLLGVGGGAEAVGALGA